MKVITLFLLLLLHFAEPSFKLVKVKQAHVFLNGTVEYEISRLVQPNRRHRPDAIPVLKSPEELLARKRAGPSECQNAAVKTVELLAVVTKDLAVAFGDQLELHVRKIMEHVALVYSEAPFQCKVEVKLVGVLSFSSCGHPDAIVERPCNTVDPVIRDALPPGHPCCLNPIPRSCAEPGPYYCLQTIGLLPGDTRSSPACWYAASSFAFHPGQGYQYVFNVQGKESSSSSEVDADHLLRTFYTWTSKNINSLKNVYGEIDAAVLLTDKDFAGYTVGIAPAAAMCSSAYPGFIVSASDFVKGIATGTACGDSDPEIYAGIANTISHELAHMLGAEHVDDTHPALCPEEPSADPLPIQCSFSDDSAENIHESRFTTVTSNQINSWFVNDYFPECLNNPSFQDAFQDRCGDGRVTGCEECDPGVGKTDSCCNSATCLLKPNCQCATCGPCCTPTGALRSATYECRPSKDADCDVAERCDGVSASCPPDDWNAQGSPCGSGQLDRCFAGQCVAWNGLCTSHIDGVSGRCEISSIQDRCDLLWCEDTGGQGGCTAAAGQSDKSGVTIDFEGKVCGDGTNQCICGQCRAAQPVFKWRPSSDCNMLNGTLTVVCVDETGAVRPDADCVAADRPSNRCCGPPTPAPTLPPGHTHSPTWPPTNPGETRSPTAVNNNNAANQPLLFNIPAPYVAAAVGGLVLLCVILCVAAYCFTRRSSRVPSHLNHQHHHQQLPHHHQWQQEDVPMRETEEDRRRESSTQTSGRRSRSSSSRLNFGGDDADRSPRRSRKAGTTTATDPVVVQSFPPPAHSFAPTGPGPVQQSRPPAPPPPSTQQQTVNSSVDRNSRLVPVQLDPNRPLPPVAQRNERASVPKPLPLPPSAGRPVPPAPQR